MLCYLYIKFNLPKITNNVNLTKQNVCLYNIGKFYQYGGLYMNNVHNSDFYRRKINELLKQIDDKSVLIKILAVVQTHLELLNKK